MTSTAATLVPLSPSRERAVASVASSPAISGLCFPGSPDSAIDELGVRSILARRERMAEVLGSPALPLHPALNGFVRELARASAMDALPVFDSAWSAAVFRWRPPHIVDDVPFEPAFADRVRWALSTAAERGPARDGVLVSPPLKEPLGYLYFPAHNALLNIGDGPVAVARDEKRIRITNADGHCFTLPLDTDSIPRGVHAGGAVLALERAGAWPILNGVPMFTRVAPEKPAPWEEAQKSRPILLEAVQLLETVWPAAKAFVERWIRGVLVMRYAGHSRSHTSVHAPQVLICSAESASKVGEAMCHELSHARMFILMESETIIQDDFARRHRSPWRRDSRPLIGLINGVHAFLNVCRYYQRLSAFDGARWGREAEVVLKTQIPRIREAWTYIGQHAAWTKTGERVAHDLNAAVEDLCR